eukprot:7003168-Lingulodinium_polyedra.AAC.1
MRVGCRVIAAVRDVARGGKVPRGAKSPSRRSGSACDEPPPPALRAVVFTPVFAAAVCDFAQLQRDQAL